MKINEAFAKVAEQTEKAAELARNKGLYETAEKLQKQADNFWGLYTSLQY